MIFLLLSVANQGLSAASRILPIIDQQNKITDKINSSALKLKNSTIKFSKVNFAYEEQGERTLNSITLEL